MRRARHLPIAIPLLLVALVRCEPLFRIVWRRVVRRVDAATDRHPQLGDPMPGAGAGLEPVLLVAGYANDERAMGPIGRSLERDGFRVERVTMPDYGMGCLHVQKRVLRARVARMRRRLGVECVHVIGFSSGGFAARAAAQLDGGDHGIGRVVTIATGNDGFHFGPLDWLADRIAPLGVRQIRRGSEFIKALHDTRHGADVVSIGTRGMDGVVPNPSAYRIDGKPFHAVDDDRRIGPFSRVTHARICRDDHAYETLRRVLLGHGPASPSEAC